MAECLLVTMLAALPTLGCLTTRLVLQAEPEFHALRVMSVRRAALSGRKIFVEIGAARENAPAAGDYVFSAALDDLEGLSKQQAGVSGRADHLDLKHPSRTRLHAVKSFPQDAEAIPVQTTMVKDIDELEAFVNATPNQLRVLEVNLLPEDPWPKGNLLLHHKRTFIRGPLLIIVAPRSTGGEEATIIADFHQPVAGRWALLSLVPVTAAVDAVTLPFMLAWYFLFGWEC